MKRIVARAEGVFRLDLCQLISRHQLVPHHPGIVGSDVFSDKRIALQAVFVSIRIFIVHDMVDRLVVVDRVKIRAKEALIFVAVISAGKRGLGYVNILCAAQQAACVLWVENIVRIGAPADKILVFLHRNIRTESENLAAAPEIPQLCKRALLQQRIAVMESDPVLRFPVS